MKTVVVSGGTRGIGLAVCKLFAEKGYRVVAFYSKDEESAKKARETLPQAEFIRVDVSEEEEVKLALGNLPRIDVLVNNAGVSSFGQVQDISAQEWRRVFSVNTDGAFFCTKYAAKKMISQGEGAIINISSVWGQTGGSCESAYSATKGALISFTKAVAKELAPSSVRVNCVAPGVIDTEMNGKFSEEELAALCGEIPLMRMGKAEEVASAVLFLAENGYITGEVLSVNGGFFI